MQQSAFKDGTGGLGGVQVGISADNINDVLGLFQVIGNTLRRFKYFESILISGGGNFPVRKKEKQNRAADANVEEWQQIQGLLDKIKSTGMGGINADEPDAVAKLSVWRHSRTR